MENAFKSFPQIYFSRSTNTDLPAFVGERRILIIKKKPNQTIYSTFYDNLETYMVKISSSLAKKAVAKLIERQLIFLGKDLDSSKNGIIGTIIINRKALAGVVLEVADLEIDPTTGETSNIDSCFYASYFEFIRAAVLINRDDIRQNSTIMELCIQFLFYLILRLLGKNIQLNDKQKEILKILVSYFFYRHQMSETHPLSVEKAFKGVSKELSDEILSEFDTLGKYKTMRDIFSAMLDLKITTEMPNRYIISSLKKLNSTGFFSVFTSLDYLIAFIIISSYPVQFIGTNVINTTIQTKLERAMSKYINKVNFDTTAIK